MALLHPRDGAGTDPQDEDDAFDDDEQEDQDGDSDWRVR